MPNAGLFPQDCDQESCSQQENPREFPRSQSSPVHTVYFTQSDWHSARVDAAVSGCPCITWVWWEVVQHTVPDNNKQWHNLEYIFKLRGSISSIGYTLLGYITQGQLSLSSLRGRLMSIVSFISWCYNCSFSRGASDKLRGKDRCGVFAGKTVWSTPERLRGEVLTTRRYTNLRLALPLPKHSAPRKTTQVTESVAPVTCCC